MILYTHINEILSDNPADTWIFRQPVFLQPEKKMQAQKHFRENTIFPFPDYTNDIERNQVYLLVNCAGYEVMPEPFQRIQPGGRNDYYMMYMQSGSLAVTTGDRAETCILSPGHLFIIPPHTFFRYEPVGTDSVQYLWVHFTGYGAADLLADCALTLLTPCSVGFPEEAETKYQELFNVFLHREPCMDTAAVSRLMDICVLFGRTLYLQNRSDSLTGQSHRLHTSLTYIHENLDAPLTIPMLAEMEHLGVSRYRALFHEIFGVSPMAYITRLRIQQSMTYLQQTDLSIAKIASSVGYEDPLYFSRVFRQVFGFSPKEYRNRLTQKTL